MLVGLGGRVIGYHGDFSNKRLHEDVSGKNHRICSRDTDI